jgi:hypothetical protein
MSGSPKRIEDGSIEDGSIDVATRVGVEGLVLAGARGGDDGVAVPIAIAGRSALRTEGLARSRANKVNSST